MTGSNSKCSGVYAWRPWFPPKTFFNAIKTYFTTTNLKKLVNNIEQTLENLLQSKHVLLMPSGTTAIFTAIHVLLPKGYGEVLLPSLVCETVPFAVKAAGKKPCFLEIDANTLNVDGNLIGKRISNKTEAIIAVHQSGMPCNMTRVSQIAKENNLLLIEDAAQALGAEYNGKKVGTIGDVGILSFNNKVIDACGGAAIVTDNDEFYRTLKRYRDEHFTLIKKGFFKHMLRSWLLCKYPKLGIGIAEMKHSQFQPEIRKELNIITPLLLQSLLPKLNYIIEKRRANFSLYDRCLIGSDLQKPVKNDNAKSCCTFYTIKLNHSNRDAIQEALEKRGIHTVILAESMHKKYGDIIDMPVTDNIAQIMLSFPTDPHLDAMKIKFGSEIFNNICGGRLS